MQGAGGSQAVQGISLVSPTSSSSVCFKSERKFKTKNKVAEHYEEFRYPLAAKRGQEKKEGF